jgi:uncharacterized membrane protein YdjX (TVP38/TMEM64 family)
MSESAGRKRRLRRAAPLLLLMLAGMLVFAAGGGNYLSLDVLRQHRSELIGWREAYPVATMLAFMAAYVIVVTLSVPGAVWMTIIAGFLFGPAAGTVLVVIAATAGACIVFLAARYALADLLRDRASGAIARMQAGFRRDAFSYLLFLRLVPLFPFWLVNLVPAFLDVRLATFALATLIGIIPGSLVYVLVGNGVGSILDAGGTPDLHTLCHPTVLVPILGLAALALAPVVFRRQRGKNAGEAP